MNYFKSIKIIAFAILVILVSTSHSASQSNTNKDDYIINKVSNNKKQIAITFDDGPHPKETDKILDILSKYNVKATFFVVGKHVDWYSEPVIRASREGHEIGNHTYNHPNINNLSKKQLLDEIYKCELAIIDKTGKKPTVFRPPFGNFDDKIIQEISKETGYSTILWSSVDVKDWKNPSAQYMSNEIIKNTKSGDIILLHDYCTESTVKSLETIISSLIDRGYEFVTVSELLKNNKN